jgi:hypothetical protein
MPGANAHRTVQHLICMFNLTPSKKKYDRFVLYILGPKMYYIVKYVDYINRL